MSLVCQLRQLDADSAHRFIDDPDEFLTHLDKLEKEEDGLDLDKAWHGLHYLLTGTAWAGQEPACYLVAGGEQIGDEEEHDVGYGPARVLLPPQVAAFASAVSALTPAEIQRRFNAAEMTKLKIYPEIWQAEGPEAQERYNYLAESAVELHSFLSNAAEQQHAVVIYLS